MPKFKGDMIQLIKMRHSNIQATTPKEKRKKKEAGLVNQLIMRRVSPDRGQLAPTAEKQASS